MHEVTKDVEAKIPLPFQIRPEKLAVPVDGYLDVYIKNPTDLIMHFSSHLSSFCFVKSHDWHFYKMGKDYEMQPYSLPQIGPRGIVCLRIETKKDIDHLKEFNNVYETVEGWLKISCERAYLFNRDYSEYEIPVPDTKSVKEKNRRAELVKPSDLKIPLYFAKENEKTAEIREKFLQCERNRKTEKRLKGMKIDVSEEEVRKLAKFFPPPEKDYFFYYLDEHSDGEYTKKEIHDHQLRRARNYIDSLEWCVNDELIKNNWNTIDKQSDDEVKKIKIERFKTLKEKGDKKLEADWINRMVWWKRWRYKTKRVLGCTPK